MGNCKTHPYAVADCHDKEKVEGMFAEVKRDHGRLDVRVGNVSITRSAVMTTMIK